MDQQFTVNLYQLIGIVVVWLGGQLFVKWVDKRFLTSVNVFTGKEKRGTTFTIPMSENVVKDFFGYFKSLSVDMHRMTDAIERQVSFTTKAVENTAKAAETVEKVMTKIEQVQKDIHDDIKGGEK